MPEDSLMPHSTYHKHGFPNRSAYLKSLAADFGVPPQRVFTLADMLGPDEDFDGLLVSLDDYSCMLMGQDFSDE
jgi:hypothetical protein